MTSITTKIGDKGTTRLFSGETVVKDCERIDAYGDLDELVSSLGIVYNVTTVPFANREIRFIQRELFVAGSEMATSLDHIQDLSVRINDESLRKLELIRTNWEQNLRDSPQGAPKGFIIPGGCLNGAHIDVARAISRRVERKAVRLQREGIINNPTLIVWFNRLSDALWLLARIEEGQSIIAK